MRASSVGFKAILILVNLFRKLLCLIFSVYPNYLMNMFARYSLILIALYMLLRTIISLFFYDQFPIAFLASEFNQDQMDAYRARVIIPALFLTCIYFTGRYLSGKSPTSTVWPLYVVSSSLLITHIIGFITFMPFSQDPITMFLLTLFAFFVTRKAHNQRKNEIF